MQKQAPCWHVTIHLDLDGRLVARFGHRKGNAGWIWDECILANGIELPMTEIEILAHIDTAVLEFMASRR